MKKIICNVLCRRNFVNFFSLSINFGKNIDFEYIVLNL